MDDDENQRRKRAKHPEDGVDHNADEEYVEARTRISSVGEVVHRVKKSDLQAMTGTVDNWVRSKRLPEEVPTLESVDPYKSPHVYVLIDDGCNCP